MDRPYECDEGGRLTGGCYLQEKGKPHRHCYCGLPMRVGALMCEQCHREILNLKTGKRGRRITTSQRAPYDDLLYAFHTGRFPPEAQVRPSRRARRVAKKEA